MDPTESNSNGSGERDLNEDQRDLPGCGPGGRGFESRRSTSSTSPRVAGFGGRSEPPFTAARTDSGTDARSTTAGTASDEAGDEPPLRLRGDEPELYLEFNHRLIRMVRAAVRAPLDDIEDAYAMAWVAFLRNQPDRDLGQATRSGEARHLSTVLLAPLLAWAAAGIAKRLPNAVRARQIGRTAEDILDLANDVDPEQDHIRGPDDAPVTLVEYGDFECSYCGQAEGVLRELLSPQGDDVPDVWRHLPLNDVHPSAQLAAEASEAQGRFWECTTPCSRTRTSSRRAISRVTRAISARRRAFQRRAAAARTRRADQRRRRERRRERSLRHTAFFINGRRHYGVDREDTRATSFFLRPPARALPERGDPAATMPLRARITRLGRWSIPGPADPRGACLARRTVNHWSRSRRSPRPR